MLLINNNKFSYIILNKFEFSVDAFGPILQMAMTPRVTLCHPVRRNCCSIYYPHVAYKCEAFGEAFSIFSVFFALFSSLVQCTKSIFYILLYSTIIYSVSQQTNQG